MVSWVGARRRKYGVWRYGEMITQRRQKEKDEDEGARSMKEKNRGRKPRLGVRSPPMLSFLQ